MTAPRALVIGEALVDAVERPGGGHEEHPGGSPANVAIGLGRLGRPVDLLTWLGDDTHGRLVTAHLAASQVNVHGGHADRTPVALARIGEDGSASYTFDLAWQVPSWRPDVPPVVAHTGSIATTLEPGGSSVVDLLTRLRPTSTITYDPNLRPAIMGSAAEVRDRVHELVALADVVKASDEDLEWLEPGRSPEDVLADWAGRGPALVVLTRGGEGAIAITAAGARIEVGSEAVDVVDTVGAGDSFMGALIDGLWTAGLLGAERRDALSRIDADTVRHVVERCARVAAITVSRAGANPPWEAEL